MLKKIENIASTTEFKNNARFNSEVHSVPLITGGKSSVSDSLSFSSAFRYLSQLKWQLKSIEHTENDELILEFVVEQLTFNTKVSIHDCKLSNITYKISNEKAFASSELNYEILISFDFESEVYSENILASSVEYLKWLFDKLASYNSMLLKNSNDPEINSFLIDGAEEKLKYELSLIHKNLIFFVEKVTGENLSSNLRLAHFNPGEKKLIKILQINVKL